MRAADFSRNLGLFTEAQQAAMEQAHIVVAGTGGMGGVAAEALCRMGVSRLTLLDHDIYEASNINRQLHASQSVLGQPKVEVIARKLLDINPALAVSVHQRLSVDNAASIVATADLVINGMDDVIASIALERAARQAGKTIVDAWITPYASVFVMSPSSPHWEEFLQFPTLGKALAAITEADVLECLRREAAFTLQQFQPFSIISPQLVDDLLHGLRPRPSLVPVVWLSGTLMANEAMKILTKQGRLASHWGVFYNQYDHQIKVLDWAGRERHDDHQLHDQRLAA